MDEFYVAVFEDGYWFASGNIVAKDGDNSVRTSVGAKDVVEPESCALVSEGGEHGLARLFAAPVVGVEFSHDAGRENHFFIICRDEVDDSLCEVFVDRLEQGFVCRAHDCGEVDDDVACRDSLLEGADIVVLVEFDNFDGVKTS